MREVGGYEQLMKLPMSAFDVIAKDISKENAEEKAEYDKARSKR